MLKTRLFTPGPTPVLPDALRVMSDPILHHRTSDFMAVLEEVRAGLKDLLGTTQEVLVLASSGTGVMEGAVCNLFSAGDKVIVVRGGKFGERWGEIARAYGLVEVALDIEAGRAPTVDDLKKRVSENLDAKAILLQACETSTGVDFPIEEIAAYTRTLPMLLVVDAISAIGISPFEMDRWGVDAVVTGSQKGLMLPPGLGFVCLNERAWEFQEKAGLPRYYFDFAKERQSIVKNQTAYTPAVSLIVGLREVLRFFKKEGKEKIFRNYQKMSAAMRAAAQAMQLELFAKRPSPGLVSIRVPQGIDGKKIVKQMRDEHQMMIAGGQGALSGKIIRISCMGHMDGFDLIAVFAALENVLRSQGAKIPFEKGVAALEKELLERA